MKHILFSIIFTFIMSFSYGYNFSSMEQERSAEENDHQAEVSVSPDYMDMTESERIDHAIKEEYEKSINSTFANRESIKSVIHTMPQEYSPEFSDAFFTQSLLNSILSNLIKFDKYIYLVVNQFSSDDFFNHIMFLKESFPKINIKFIVPRSNQSYFFEKIKSKKIKESEIYFIDYPSGLPHMKYILTDKQVLVGSSNFTPAGFKFNYETMANLIDPLSVILFKYYTDYIIFNYAQVVQKIFEDGSAKDEAFQPNRQNINNMNVFEKIKEYLNEYTVNILGNQKPRSNIRICFAPICNPGEFLKKELREAKHSIKIQMFLLNYNEVIGEIIKNIIPSSVKLKINVDKHEANMFQGMADAINLLQNYGVDVSFLYPKRKTPYMEVDSLLHDKFYIIDEKKVIISSANLTASTTDENKNLEVFVAMDDPVAASELSVYFENLRNSSFEWFPSSKR